MKTQVLPCCYCNQPMEMAVTGKPIVAHMQCAMDAMANRRAKTQEINRNLIAKREGKK